MHNLSLRREQGFSLVIVMLLFVAITIVGIAVMRSGILSQKQSINIQEKSTTFHAAQSSNSGVVNTYQYDKDTINSIVSAAPFGGDLMNHTDEVTTCLSDNGDVKECDTDTYVDNNESGVIRGSSDNYYRACYKALKCLGTSADVNAESKVGCNLFEHDGTGFIDNVSKDQAVSAGESESQINQWSTLIAACEVNS